MLHFEQLQQSNYAEALMHQYKQCHPKISLMGDCPLNKDFYFEMCLLLYDVLRHTSWN